MVAKRQNVKSSERKHLTEAEMADLIKAAGQGRHAARDRAMCLLAYRHGLRVSELIGLRLSDLDLSAGRLMVRRLKGGLATSHPMSGEVIRAVRAWLRDRAESPHKELFLSERGDPFRREGLNYLTRQWGERAGIAFRVHPHMLRHSCGYALVNRPNGSKDLRAIQDYMGHRDPRHTAHYTALAAGRFEELWGEK